MLPLKEFAHFVTLNTADLAETYIQLLQNTGQGYEQISADSCRASARKLLKAVAEACQAETFIPLSQLFDPDKETSQRWAGFQILPHQPLLEVECLGQTLTPVVTSLEAGKFLWQMLAQTRAAIMAAAQNSPASSIPSPLPGAARPVEPAEQVGQVEPLLQENAMLQQLRLAVEQSLDGLAMADLNGLVQFVNPAWAVMHGYRVEELVGQPLSLFHTAEQLRTEVEVFNARVLEKGLHQGEMGHKRKDGATFATWMSVTQIKDAAGKPIGLLAACQDITGRKQAEVALANRANELQAVTRISNALSSILDSERLLQEVVDLTKSGFDLYHAHLYLLDEAGEDLVLAAGAGEVGRKMTTQGWQIPLAHEKSLVARTARTRQGVTANDVRAEPDFLPNPDLPETRSEMAVPVMAGEKLLGVLDVQSDQVGRFSEEDVQVTTTLAAQAATAIQNARLFAQAQAALADLSESQNLLRSIIDATPDWIFIKDQEHRYRLVNQGYANSLHMPPEDFIGKNDLDIGFPEDIIKGNPEKGIRGFWADDREVMDSGNPKLVNSEPGVVDGKPVYLNTIKVPLRDAEGKVWGVLGFVRDVTERETVLAEMQQSQQLLRSIIDATPDWIFIKDEEHRYRLANQGYANALHLSPEDFLGKNDLELGFPEELVKGNPEKGIRGFWADDRLVMESGEPQVYPNDPATIDGQVHVFHTIKTPLRDAEDKVWGVLAFSRDITERETVLAEIQQSRAEAEARLRETRILQQLAQALSGTLEASEVIDAFFTASRELLAADYALFSLVDPNQKRIRAVAGFNVSEDHIRRANHPLDSSDIMADIIRSGQTEIISGWDTRFDSENFDTEGMAEWGMRIFSPITLRRESVGMVEVGFKEKVEVAIQEAQVRLLRSLVDQTVIALESAQRYEASQKMARRERNIREITEKVRQAPNLDLLAKVVAEELGKALGVSHSLVRVGTGVGSTPVTASNGKNGNGSEQADQGVTDA